MTQNVTIEIKIHSADDIFRRWEDTPINQTAQFLECQGLDEIWEYVFDLAEQTNSHLRWNFVGSFQGHYCCADGIIPPSSKIVAL